MKNNDLRFANLILLLIQEIYFEYIIFKVNYVELYKLLFINFKDSGIVWLIG
jgi:hypothetical protein